MTDATEALARAREWQMRKALVRGLPRDDAEWFADQIAETRQPERERIRAWLDGRIANADGPMAASAESLTFNGGRSAAFKEVRAILAEPSDE